MTKKKSLTNLKESFTKDIKPPYRFLLDNLDDVLKTIADDIIPSVIPLLIAWQLKFDMKYKLFHIC